MSDAPPERGAAVADRPASEPAPLAALAPVPAAPRFVFERVGGSEILHAVGVEDLRLKCGRAEIVLCADGRVILRGTELLLEADGNLKLNGATVNIN